VSLGPSAEFFFLRMDFLAERQSQNRPSEGLVQSRLWFVRANC
jgi:hypothetical protein